MTKWKGFLKERSAKRLRVQERKVIHRLMLERCDSDNIVWPVSRSVDDPWYWD